MKAGVELFRRLALTLPNTVESSHMGSPDFRIVDAKGKMRIFATLSAQDRGMGVLKLTPEQQASFVAELPKIFEPVQGGWGRMGMTYIHLTAADRATLEGALATAHRNVEANAEAVNAARKTRKTASAAPKKTAQAASTAKIAGDKRAARKKV
jgi:hypothetical protein